MTNRVLDTQRVVSGNRILEFQNDQGDTPTQIVNQPAFTKPIKRGRIRNRPYQT